MNLQAETEMDVERPTSAQKQNSELAAAVRQRVDLHPQARVEEIAAMLELDGIQAPTDLVQQIVKERHTPRREDGLVHAPPALQRE